MGSSQRNGSESGYWGYLIKPDKSAAPLLEQLCLGLAQIICNLEPGPPERLTPRRLATFYKSIGGDLDSLFLRTSESGLSLLYRTIGCFHSLEPTSNPFKDPSVPCLTPDGFVKWQTVQLLLCPEENVRYLQEAVRLYNVPRSDGGFFPKMIPAESFPDKPDVEMEAWHKTVTSRLHQENYMRQRLRNSPYHSPHPVETSDGYFGQQIPKIRRPPRSTAQDTRGDDSPHQHSRRSSEPDWVSPAIRPTDHGRSPNPYRDGGRSASGSRPAAGSRQRSATTGHPIRGPQTSHSVSRNSERPPSSFRQASYLDQHAHNTAHSPSASSEDFSAEDASSEDSRGQRQSKRSRAANSLLSVLPFTTPWHKRSRSHDASYRKDRASPRREEPDGTPPLRASTETFHRPPLNVRFKQDIFDNPAAASAPESPVYDKRPQSRPRVDTRYGRNPTGPGLTDPVSPFNYNLTRETSSGSGSERRTAYEIPARQLRKVGTPQRGRGPPVTGVQGRKYASVEQASREAPVPPITSPGNSQQDPRNPMRYSLAV